MPPLARIPLLLLIPDERVSTARAFGMLTRFSEPAGVARCRGMIAEGFLSHAAQLGNDFEEPVFAAIPRLRELKQRLYDAGATWAQMSGSGSTIVGAFSDQKTRDAAIAQFGGVKAVAAETV